MAECSSDDDDLELTISMLGLSNMGNNCCNLCWSLLWSVALRCGCEGEDGAGGARGDDNIIAVVAIAVMTSN